MEVLDHKIALENFYGPLDLLLYLIRDEELNIHEIPIVRVTEQYLNYLAMMDKLNIEIAGEFMVMASTLMTIKARSLVPPPEDDLEEEEDDPRFEFIKRLLEYKKFKDLSGRIRQLMELTARTSTRPYFDITEIYPELATAAEDEEEKSTVELDLWNLARTYSRISQEIALDVSESVIYDDIPIEKFIEAIIARLKEQGEITLIEMVRHRLAPAGQERYHILKNLLASLELARQQRVDIEQEKDFSAIKLRFRPEPPLLKDSLNTNAPLSHQDGTENNQL